MTKSFTHILFIWLSAIFFSLPTLCQVPAIEWQKCYGGNSGDGANCIQLTKDGGYIIAGTTASSNSGDVGNSHGDEDCWIIKIDSKGNIEWQKCYGGSGLDVAFSIQVTPDGGYIMAGYTRSNDGDVSGLHNNISYSDCWIVKLDSAGNIQWQKCYGGSKEDEATSIQLTPDGGYIFAGATSSNDGDVSGLHSNDYYDYWIVKLDNSGNIQWQKCYGGSRGDAANSILVTPDHGYIVTGSSNSNDGDVTGNHDGDGDDCWIIKLDSAGNIQWQRCYGGSLNEYAYSIQITPDHGYIVAGETFSNNGDVSGNHVSYTGGLPNFDDYWIFKLDSAGNLKWQRCLGGSGAEMAKSIQVTPDGGYIVAGLSTSNDGDVSGNHGGQDYWIVKINDKGDIEWQKSLGGSKDDEAEFIQPTPDGGYIIAGSSESNDGDVSGNHDLPSMPLGDAWVVKLTGPCYAQFNLSASSNNICPGTPVTFTTTITNGGNTPSWSWTVNGSVISGATANTYTSSTLHDSDLVVCSLSNGPGCTPVKDTMVVAVNRIPSVSITADTTTACSGSPVLFTAHPLWEGANPIYQWKVNSLTTGTSDTVFSTNNLQNGDVVTCDLISNNNRCAPTVTSNPIPISVIPAVTSSVSISTGATAVCSGINTTFTATAVNGGTNPAFQWEVNGFTIGANQNTFVTDSLKNGDIVNCVLTSDRVCSVPVSSDSITMTVYPVPVVTCGPDTVLASGNGTRLTTTVTGDVTAYQWSPALGLDNPTSATPFAIPPQTTTYLLEVTTTNGCTAGCQVIVTVQKKIAVPNAFSPNGDGINDVWAIPALVDFYNCTVDVFDRSGQPVFHSTGYNQPWDGTYHGKPVPFGTYYYIINPKNGFQKLSGAVTIIK